MSSTTLTDLPIEVLEKFILYHLNDPDVQNLRLLGNRRLAAIATTYSKYNRSKYFSLDARVYLFAINLGIKKFIKNFSYFRDRNIGGNSVSFPIRNRA